MKNFFILLRVQVSKFSNVKKQLFSLFYSNQSDLKKVSPSCVCQTNIKSHLDKNSECEIMCSTSVEFAEQQAQSRVGELRHQISKPATKNQNSRYCRYDIITTSNLLTSEK